MLCMLVVVLELGHVMRRALGVLVVVRTRQG